MFTLSNFLKKYQIIIKDDASLRQSISQIIQETYGLLVDGSSIKTRNTTIYINCPPAVKFEIFTKQNSILEAINHKTNLKFKEIRFT